MSLEPDFKNDIVLDRDTSNNNIYKHGSLTNSLVDVKLWRNVSMQHCAKHYEQVTEKFVELYKEGFCKAYFDGLSCWPPTPLNQTAVHKCFSELNQVQYDDTKNVTKHCFENGTWSRVNYLETCREMIPESDVPYYYFGGYILSLIGLSLAILIFTHFKELHCVRNKIHLNFMWAHLSNHVMWITSYFLSSYGSRNRPFVCLFDVILLHYSYTATFFWMFVEGLYLYVLVVQTLTHDIFNLRVYVGIGWGLPMFITILWSIGRSIVHSMDRTSNFCQWFYNNNTDLIVQIPVGIVVFLNFLFLMSILCVLVNKLRSSSRVEHQHYYKAAKALLVLNPLLGTTYVFTFYAPSFDSDGSRIFECVRAVLLSTQGFVVALFYCFRNSDVQNTISHHFHNWRESKSLGNSRMRTSSKNKDRRSTEWTLVHTDETDIDGSTTPIRKECV